MSEEAATLTLAMLEAAIARIRDYEYPPPHGSKERPHLAHPNHPNLCIECGWRASDHTVGLDR